MYQFLFNHLHRVLFDYAQWLYWPLAIRAWQEEMGAVDCEEVAEGERPF